MDIALIIGYLASICSVTSFIPQVIKVIRTADTAAISATHVYGDRYRLRIMDNIRLSADGMANHSHQHGLLFPLRLYLAAQIVGIVKPAEATSLILGTTINAPKATQCRFVWEPSKPVRVVMTSPTYNLMGLMKIATYNVNGVNGRLEGLIRWLQKDRPDIVGLQELKTVNEKFPFEKLESIGYGSVWHGEKGFNGVAILARDTTPVLTRVGLPGPIPDPHSRYIEAAVAGILVGCL